MSLTNRRSLPHTLGIAEMSQSDCCVLEVFGEDVGLLIMERGSFVFRAAVPEAYALDHHQFPSVRAAEQAVRQRLSLKRRSRSFSTPAAGEQDKQ